MRHGIYRDFPLTFKDAGGTLREVTFSLLGVSRDGNPEPYHTERTHGVIRIYAGDKDVLIRPGEHTYVFELSHRAADPLVRRQAGAQLERHRQLLALPDRIRGLSPAACRRRASGALDRLYRPARRARYRLARQLRPARHAQRFDHAAACARRRPYRGRRLAGRRGRSAQREHAAVVRNVRQSPVDHRRRRLPRGSHLLLRGLGGRRPRSQARHHHSAIPSAAGHFAGARQLHPQLGPRAREMARLHRGRALARRARAHPARPRPARR